MCVCGGGGVLCYQLYLNFIMQILTIFYFIYFLNCFICFIVGQRDRHKAMVKWYLKRAYFAMIVTVSSKPQSRRL